MTTTSTIPVVAWHTGGPLWAGDTQDHPPGWYVYGLGGPHLVFVRHPHTELAIEPVGYPELANI